jgi:hypothetical protein
VNKQVRVLTLPDGRTIRTRSTKRYVVVVDTGRSLHRFDFTDCKRAAKVTRDRFREMGYKAWALQ